MGQHVRPNQNPSPLGPHWDDLRFNQLGWRLLPLRGFLGITFVYAGLQKIANPNYFNSASPTSFVAQSRALESTSPIAPLLRMALHAPTFFALLIALGELAVGLGILVGLWTRVAALGGIVLSLTFFLTVSWSTTPYFYGSDIVFVFAWSVFAMCGAGGVLCLDAWISARADAVPRSGGMVDPVRRHLLVGARSAAFLTVFGGALAGATALIGRAAGSTKTSGLRGPSGASGSHALASPSPTDPPRHRHHRPAPVPNDVTAPPPSAAPQQPSGTALGPVSAVPVGQGRQFTDPASGQPGWMLRPSTSKVVAFSAVCTHAGCTVSFDSANNQFVCPCHGGTYDASTGAVTGGPPPSPLAQIPARIANNEIWVD